MENVGASKPGGSKKLGLGQEAIYAQPLPWEGGWSLLASGEGAGGWKGPIKAI